MRLPAPLSFVARLRAALGTEAAALRQAFAALLVSSGGDLLAGVTLAGITGRLEELPGLIILIPAAIGMRGNIYGALGSRLGTAIHTGQFSLSRRRETLVGQNIWASGVLTLVIAVAMAFAARAVAGIFGNDSISVADFVVISVLGGVLSSVIVLGVTLGVATLAVRRSWDMDNVAAPLVTASGDMVTLPSLVLASLLVGLTGVTVVVAVLCVIAAVVALVLAWRAEHAVLRRIVRESVPVLLVASAIDIAAGVTIEQQLDHLIAYPALLVLVPPFLEDTGALGGVLSSRLSSKLHLGIIEPTARPQRAARIDFALILLLAVPVFVLLAVSADIVAWVFGMASPGPLRMVAIALGGGLVSTFVAMVVAYYGAIVTVRLGLDPDNHGVPLLTSTLDLVGALSLIGAITLLAAT
ncbi:MAG: magnesium transporter [Acidimicrobiales bacterium]|nr:magnesium transporter [Acidimicrobiales bacterium]